MTVDASNVNQKAVYNGNETLTVGNRTRVPISHIRNSVVKTKYVDNSTIILKNMLHVPWIKRNLISIA